MSQQLPAASSHPPEHSPESSLNERYTYSPALEDPYLTQEAQHLLSQFIRTSSREPQSHRTTEIVVHGHNAFRGTRKDRAKRDTRSPMRWGTARAVNGDATSAPSREQRSHTANASGSWHQQRHRKASPLKTSSSLRQTASPKANAAESLPQTKLPTRVRDNSSPASIVSSSTKENQYSRQSSLGMDSQGFKPARRSGRPRSGPANYYAKPPSYPFDPDEPDEKHSEPDSRPNDPSGLRSAKLQGSRYSLACRGGQSGHLQSQHCNRTRNSHPDWQSALRHRELGRPVNPRLHSGIAAELKLHKSWKGASNDVIVSTWSPDGSRFIAGATAQCDEHNMEYNRGNNLVLGDLATNSLKELPDHWVPRPTHRRNRNMSDSRLFMSVTAVQWFEDLIFSASYDRTVKLWDATSHTNTRCLKTLRHSSKVQVMARSNFNPNVLATGTQSIGLWNIDDASYSPLDVARSYNKDMELEPTSLVWGQIPATKDILLAGMEGNDAEDDGIPYSGLLAMWIAHEASMVPVQPIPNSQNVFDIKWHPSLPVFATANPLGSHQIAKSCVRVYEPLVMRTRSIEFDCPALDINDITFCPWDPNYLTASCTDGITYVWDRRRPDQIVHRLEHDPPLNQLDENLTRERADVGVRLALWGNAMDQFYSGASDGVLKRWNILQSPEDVLVDDVMSFSEEIMCGAFSDDKSNLLVGDGGGGLHVLSSSPFSYPQEDRQMQFELAAAPGGDSMSDSESGVAAGDLLLSSGQLARHPVYGVGQGPYYRGPFAAWARPEGTPQDQIAQTPLEPRVQAQQLDRGPVKDRLGLDDESREYVQQQIKLGQIRNRRKEAKRKRRNNYINLVSDEEDMPKPPTPKGKKGDKRKSRSLRPVITRVEAGIIDLTAEDESESPVLEEDLEEDFWWPDSANIDPNITEGDM